MTTAADFPLWHYRGTPTSVHDGDTFTVDRDCGAHILHGLSVRIRGIDAPELHDPDESVRIAAAAARDRLSSLISGKTVFFVTHKDGKSFDRYVADVFIEGPDGILEDVGAALVAGGFAAEETR